MITASPRAEILTAREVDEERIRRLVGVCAEFGVEAEVKRQREHRGTAELGWLVLLALPLHGFLDTLGKKTAEDFYTRICHALKRGAASRAPELKIDAEQETGKSLTLLDSASGLRIELDISLPAEAFQQLAELDLGAVDGDRLRYDREAGLWRTDRGSAVQ